MFRYRLIAFLAIAAVVLAACGGAAPAADSTPGTEQVPVTGATEGPGLASPTVGAVPTEAAGETTSPTEAAGTISPTEGAGAAPQLESTELNLYAWSEYVPQALLDGFTERTGVTVNYDTYSSNEELLAKLQAGASGYDLVIPSDYTVDIMKKQGLIEPLDKSLIPNISNLDEQFTNLDFDPGNEYSVPYQWGTVGLVVDRSQVDQELTSWNDLWSPEYEGRVVLLDDSREVIGMALLTLGYDKNSTDPAQLQEAQQKLMELLPNVRLFDSDSPKTALLAGEVWLGQTWNGEAAIAHQENPDIDYICPTEGCGIWFDNFVIPTGAPHRDAAHAFINYVLEPEASLLITQEFPYSNPNRAALELLQTQDPEAYEVYMGFTATNPSPEDVQNGKMIVDVGEATAEYDRIWTEIKGSQP